MQAYVAELHEAGVIWGDVKPYNVLVNEHGIYIIDFGGSYTDGWSIWRSPE